MIKIRKIWEIPESNVTPEPIYLRRREFMKASGMLGTALLLNPWTVASASIPIGDYQRNVITPDGEDEEITPEDDATSYNNFMNSAPLRVTRPKTRKNLLPMTGISELAVNVRSRVPIR